MNYKETIKYIEYTENQKRQTNNSRMKSLMAGLGNPQDKLAFIHVGGTNGKGSCVSSLSSILKEANYKVGTYTSPHLIKYEERIAVNGSCISQKDFIKYASIIKEKANKLNLKPTVFEKLTAIAFMYFNDKKCDVVVLEVGLGGRLDATNIIKKPILSILMNIGLEHTEVLGDTIEKIAKEKAGIIKTNSDVICYYSNPKAIKVFKEVAKEKKSNIYVIKNSDIKIKKEGIKAQVFDYKDIKNIKLNLLGKHQFYNGAVIVEACLLLNKKGYHISTKNIKDGLLNTTWDARLSILNKEPLFILDGAHNPQCANALKDSLPKILGKKKAIILCGMLKDKDYKSTMKMLIPFAKEFVCITPDSYRALKADDLKEYLISKKQIATSAKSINGGIKLSLSKAKKNDVIIALGSLYLAGTIKEIFDKKRFS